MPTQTSYINALIIILSFFLVAKIIAFIFEKYFKKWIQKSKNKMEEVILPKVKPTLIRMLVLIGLRFAVSQLGFSGWILNTINSIIILMIVYVGSTMADIAIEAWTIHIDKKNKSHLAQSILPIFNSIANVLFYIGGLIWILYEWNIDVSPFLASLGIAGVIVGFAIQDSLKNIFGGIALILDGTFKINEKIQLDDGEIGTIEDISIRSTKIKTINNELITIPNGKLADMKIKNFAKPTSNIRMLIHFGVAYGTNIDKLRDVVEKLLDSTENITKDKASSLVILELDDSSINCEIRFWTNDHTIGIDKKAELIEKLYNTLNKEGIEIPFPTQTVYIKN
ncbi:MAG: mechanosensitive ion channel family protein [Candidatus Pacebacteria bacterium]|nr:mechanosensitive ion channel family protein [Candidatus Paceibacterota bacterium]